MFVILNLSSNSVTGKFFGVYPSVFGIVLGVLIV